MPRIRILPLAIVFGLLTIVCLTALKWSPLGIGVSTLTVVFLFILRIVKNRRPEEKIRGDNGWKRTKRTLKSEFAAVMISVLAAYILFGAVQRLPEPVGPWMVERAAWAAPREQAVKAIESAFLNGDCDKAEDLIVSAWRKSYISSADRDAQLASVEQCRKPAVVVEVKETVVVQQMVTPVPTPRYQRPDLGQITVNVRSSNWDSGGAGAWSTMFAVFDSAGQPITHLQKRDFAAVVQGLEVDFAMGAGMTQGGIPTQSLVFVPDTSGSMEPVGLNPIVEGIKTFDTPEKAGWVYGLVECGGNAPRIRVRQLTNIDGILANFAGPSGLRIYSDAKTPLFGSILEAVNIVGKGGHVVVFTDGANTSFEHVTKPMVIDAAVNAGVTIHTIGLRTPDYDAYPLQQMAEATGGVYLDTPDPSALAGLFGQVADSLFAYSISGYSTSSAPKVVIGANNAVIDLFTGQVTTDPGLIRTMISYR